MTLVRSALKIVLAGVLGGSAAFPLRAPDFRHCSEERLAPARPLFGPADTVSMFVIGDVMLHERQMSYSYGPFLEHISGRMKAADITVANMEFPLGGKPYSGYPAFSAPDEYACYINSCGANVFLAANNHILDKGYTGIERTIHVYDSLEAAGAIRYAGISADSLDNAGRYPLIVNVRGVRIALLNFTYGTNNPVKRGKWPKVNLSDTTDIAEALSRAKERKPDFIVAFPHWGEEYELRHSARQEKLAKWLVAKGGQCHRRDPPACGAGFVDDCRRAGFLFPGQRRVEHECGKHPAGARRGTEVRTFHVRRHVNAAAVSHLPMVLTSRQIHGQLHHIAGSGFHRKTRTLAGPFRL